MCFVRETKEQAYAPYAAKLPSNLEIMCVFVTSKTPLKLKVGTSTSFNFNSRNIYMYMFQMKVHLLIGAMNISF